MKIIKEVSKSELKDFLYEGMNIEDYNIYKEARDPDKIGIFQMNGGSASFMIEKIQPQNFDELNACNAFARPGTIDFADNYVENRDYKKSPYPRQVQEILSETNQIILYQEQVMKVFNEVGGFTLEETNCLSENMKIHTDKGNISIKDIVKNKLEVKVLTLNEKTGDFEWKKIKDYFSNGKKDLIEIELENGKFIKCTPEHEIFTTNRGWVKAIDLNQEDELIHNSP
jgi:hypothetical protein